MTLEKKQIKESLKEKEEKKVIETVRVKEAEPSAALEKSKTAPEAVEVAYVKGRLLGKNALVTGGSVGIGNAIARRFTHEGAKVCFTYNTNKDEAIKTVNEIEEFGGEAICTRCDVRDSERVFKVVEEAEASLGSVDILVNNAGMVDVSLVADMPLEKWQNMFKVHVDGTFLFCKAVLKNMKKGGRIINMSSTSGLQADALESSYAAAKAAIIALTQSLALEVANKGITVNAIAPGMVYTAMTKMLEAYMPDFSQNIPLKRFGKPEDVAEVAAFLASPGANYITGQTIVVDGGMSLVMLYSQPLYKMMGLL